MLNLWTAACLLTGVIIFIAGWITLSFITHWNEQEEKALENEAPTVRQLLQEQNHRNIQNLLNKPHPSVHGGATSLSSDTTTTTSPSASSTSAGRTIARHQARASELRARFGSKKAEAAASSDDEDVHRSAYVEEIASDEEVDGLLTAEENSGAVEPQSGEELTESFMVQKSIQLLELLLLDQDGNLMAYSQPNIRVELDRLLVEYARLLSSLSVVALNTFSARICQEWIEFDGFDSLTWIMQQRSENQIPEQAEVQEATEFILHTLVPLVWSA